MAALELNRDFIGFELDEKYFKQAEQRIRDASLQVRIAEALI